VKIYNISFYILFISLVLALSACSRDITDGMAAGRLHGHIDIGPLCPVERNPPDPNCQPTEETYKAWPISIWTQDRKTKIRFAIAADAQGEYDVDLPVGKYYLGLDKGDGIGGSNLPALIEIKKDKTTEFNITIDTGMR
jgi:hypothetical protein